MNSLFKLNNIAKYAFYLIVIYLINMFPNMLLAQTTNIEKLNSIIYAKKLSSNERKNSFFNATDPFPALIKPNISGSNPKPLLDSIIIHSLNYSDKKFYFLYENNRLAGFIQYVGLEGQWSYNAHMAISYDSIGNIASLLTQVWEGSWSDLSRDYYSYDSLGNIILDQHETFVDTGWVNKIRWTYNYNENNQCVSTITEIWNDTDWVNDNRTVLNYNLSGETDSTRNDIWDGESWVNYIYNSYDFYNDGNKKSQTMKLWSGSLWMNFAYNYFTYDSYGNNDTTINEIWGGSQWRNNLKYIYSYDTSNCYIQGRCQIYTNSDWISGDGTFINSIFPNYNIGCFGVDQTNYYKNVSDIQDKMSVLSGYMLFQNYPNPFNPSTLIKYQIPKAGNVTLKVYDILGKEVANLVNEFQKEGRYNVNFDASKLASGVYIYQIKSNEYTSSKKMMLIK